MRGGARTSRRDSSTGLQERAVDRLAQRQRRIPVDGHEPYQPYRQRAPRSVDGARILADHRGVENDEVGNAHAGGGAGDEAGGVGEAGRAVAGGGERGGELGEPAGAGADDDLALGAPADARDEGGEALLVLLRERGELDADAGLEPAAARDLVGDLARHPRRRQDRRAAVVDRHGDVHRSLDGRELVAAADEHAVPRDVERAQAGAALRRAHENRPVHRVARGAPARRRVDRAQLVGAEDAQDLLELLALIVAGEEEAGAEAARAERGGGVAGGDPDHRRAREEDDAARRDLEVDDVAAARRRAGRDRDALARHAAHAGELPRVAAPVAHLDALDLAAGGRRRDLGGQGAERLLDGAEAAASHLVERQVLLVEAAARPLGEAARVDE